MKKRKPGGEMASKWKMSKPYNGTLNSSQNKWTRIVFDYIDEGAWKAAVHRVTESWTRLSDFTFTFYLHALEKEMATHSSILAWRIPGMAEPGGLPSLGSHRVGHDWSNLTASSNRQWRTGKPGMQQPMGSQSDVSTQLNWTDALLTIHFLNSNIQSE